MHSITYILNNFYKLVVNSYGLYTFVYLVTYDNTDMWK